MKFVRLAIGAVIAIAVVGVIVLSINNTTKEVDTGKNYEWDLVITDISDTSNVKYEPSNIFNDIKSFINLYGDGDNYVDLDNGYFSYNIYTDILTVVINDPYNMIHYDFNTLILDDDEGELILTTYTIITDIPITIPAQVSGVSAVMLNLAPLIFIAGILGVLFVVVPKSKED